MYIVMKTPALVFMQFIHVATWSPASTVISLRISRFPHFPDQTCTRIPLFSQLFLFSPLDGKRSWCSTFKSSEHGFVNTGMFPQKTPQHSEFACPQLKSVSPLTQHIYTKCLFLNLHSTHRNCCVHSIYDNFVLGWGEARQNNFKSRCLKQY